MIMLFVLAELAPTFKRGSQAIKPRPHPENELELDFHEPTDSVVAVLERAADDPTFIACLTREGCKALLDYDLTMEEKAALMSGDIRWLEGRVGKLDKRLSTWPLCRLEQEIW